MSRGIITLETLDSIADAIRARSDSSDQYTPAQMPQAILDIPSGGGGGAVSGVKGDAEPLYRTGNVNLTPANIGAPSKTDLTSISATGSTNATGATITSGTFFYLDGTLVRALADIANGATFTLNTNYETVTAGGLNVLAVPQPVSITMETDKAYIEAGGVYTFGRLVIVQIRFRVTSSLPIGSFASGFPIPYGSETYAIVSIFGNKKLDMSINLQGKIQITETASTGVLSATGCYLSV